MVIPTSTGNPVIYTEFPGFGGLGMRPLPTSLKLPLPNTNTNEPGGEQTLFVSIIFIADTTI